MPTKDIIFIDSTVADYKTLVSQAKPATEVIVLDNSKDGVSQITEALVGRNDLASIQIISHGGEGMVQLGATVLSNSNLEDYSSQLQQWGNALADDGDILFYGCNVATGNGAAFVEKISEITGADVAASDDLTGNSALGGDWELEVKTGLIEADLGINNSAIANYDGLLDIIKVTNTNDSGTGSLRWAIEQATRQKLGFDVIDLRDVSGRIFLNDSLPSITAGNNLFLIGDGDITIDGRNQHQIISYSIDSKFNEVLGIQGVNFANGLARGGDGNNGAGGGLGAGGAIFINTGRVTIDNVSFNANQARGGSSSGQAGGGGVDGNPFNSDGFGNLSDEEKGKNGGTGGRINVNGDSSFYNTSEFQPGDGGKGHGRIDPRPGAGAGSSGSNGAFGSGGGGGGGGAGDPGDGENPGRGGSGGSGGFGAGGGGGGGAGQDDDRDGNADEWNYGGSGGSGGTYGGSGKSGSASARSGDYRQSASGGTGGGGAGLGGAIFARRNSSLNISNSNFYNNSVTGGSGYSNGRAYGSAIAKEVSGGTSDNNTNSNNTDVNIYADLNKSLTSNTSLPIVKLESVSASIEEGSNDTIEVTLSSNQTFSGSLQVFYFIDATNSQDNDFKPSSRHGVLNFNPGNNKNQKIQIVNPLANNEFGGLNESFEIRLLPGKNYLLEGLDKGLNNNAAIKKTAIIEDNEPHLKISTIANAKRVEGEIPREPKDLFEIKLLKADSKTYRSNPNSNAKIKLEIAGSAVRGAFANTQAGSDYKLFYIAYGADGKEVQSRQAVSNPVSGQNIYEIDMPQNATRIVLQVEDINDEIFEQVESITAKILDYDSSKKYYARFDDASSIATVELIDNEPTVSLGKVVNPTEGLGFGSTIAGLKDALSLSNKRYIAVAEDAVLNLSTTKQFTQEAWIFSNFTDNNQHGILGYQSGTAQGYPSISVVNQTGIEIGFGDGSSWNTRTVAGVLNSKGWNHLAATYDGTDYKLYVNAVEVFSTSDFKGKNIAASQQLEIGKVGESYFEGAIDEVRVWNVARSAGEIQSLLISELEGNESGLVGYWNFNGNNQNNAVNSNRKDASPQVNSYIKNPAPQIGYVEVNLDKPFTGPQGLWVQYEVLQKQTKALKFDGINDYVSVNHSNSLNITDEVTIEAWVNLKNANNNQKLIGKTPIGSGYVIGVEGGKLYPEFWDSQGKVHAFQQGNIKSNEWTHIAVSWKTNGQLIGYINGEEVGRINVGSAALGTNNNNLIIGAAPWDRSSFKVDGIVDEVRIWNTARSQADIQANMNQTLEGNEAGLVSYWDFQDSVNDKTSNKNNGSLVNSDAQSAYVAGQNISSGAKLGEDYLSSRYRKVSNDAKTERNGIIITEGQTSGKIYFSALSDAVVEDDEDIQIRLIPHNFDDEKNSSNTNSNYGIKGGADAATITIKDNKVYQKGIILLDKKGQVISKQNPLGVRNNQVEFTVQLASQPTGNVTVNLKQDNGTSIGNLVFTPDNWDKSQSGVINSVNGSGKINVTANGYLANDVNFDFTTELPIRVTEGSTTDAVPVTPKVSITKQGDIKEDDGLSSSFVINLSAPAPEDITINYTVTGTANNNDYQAIGVNQIVVAKGSTNTTIPILPIADRVAENDESIIINLSSGQGYEVDKNADRATVKLINDDRPGIEVVNAQLVDDGTGKQVYSYSNNLVNVVTNEPLPNVGNIIEIRDNRGTLLGSATVSSENLISGKVAVNLSGTIPTDKNQLQANLKESGEGNFGFVINSNDKLTLNGSTVEVALPQTTSQATVGVRLKTKPNGNVTVAFPGIDATETSLDKTTLTFTPQNWDVYQNVTISGVDDKVPDGDIIYNLAAKVTETADSKYNQQSTSIEIKNLDDDEILDPTGDLSNIQDKPEDPIARIGKAITVNEDAGIAKVEVTLSKAANKEVNVLFDTFDSSADINRDYTVSQKTLIKQFESDGRKRFAGPLDNLQLSDVGSKPTFVDLDGDNDLDLVVGTQSNGIRYFQNTGGVSLANFEEQSGSSNPFNQIKLIGAAPTFADLDGNGTPDLVLGGTDGSLNYYVNTGGLVNPRFTLPTDLNPKRSNPFANLKLENNSTPFLVDFDGDGDFDVVSGGQRTVNSTNLHLSYYENIGSKTNPNFKAASSISNINAGVNSVPYTVDWNGDGKLDLILSQQSGSVKLFLGEVSGFSSTSVNLINQSASEVNGNSNNSNITGATFADLNGDGYLDGFVSNSTGINYYEQFSLVKFAPGETSKTIDLKIIDDKIAEREEETVGSETTPEGFKKQETIKVNLFGNTGYRLENKDSSIATTVTITDNDTPGVTIIPLTGNNITSESGGNSSFSIKLNSQPIDNVVVYLGSQDESEALLTVNKDLTELDSVYGFTFTPENWNQARTFYVKGVDDKVDDGDKSYNIVATLFSEDQNYHRLQVAPIQLENKDNDQAGFTITGAGKAVEGRENIYSVKLNTQPVGEVRLIATPTNDQIRLNNELVGEPHTLIFTTENWNLDQTVRATALDDSVVEYLHFSEVAFTVETGQGLDFESKADNSLAKNALDLGDIQGGYHWTNLAIVENDADWFKFSIPDTGNQQNFARIDFPADAGDLKLELFKATDLQNPLQTANSSNSSDGKKLKQISLQGQPFGEYYLKISGQPNNYNLLVADADYQFTQAVPDNVPVVIEDNDLPTVTIIPGETASEVFGKPSYFAFQLNAPAPANDNGLKINYKLKGGSATLNEDINGNGILDKGEDRNNNGTLDIGDYNMQTEGFVRIAPGDIQNNLVVVPIDDKLIEAFELKVIDKPQNLDISKGELKLKITTPIKEVGQDKTSVSETDTDFSNNNNTNGRLFANDSAIGTVSQNGDRDRFKIDLKAGVEYTFDLEGSPTNKGTLSDSYLRLYDSNGKEVASNDDGGESRNSRIKYTATNSGTFFVETAGYGDNRTGTYKLTATAPGVISESAFPQQISLNDETEIKFSNDLVATIAQKSTLQANKSKGVYEGEITVKVDPLRVKEIVKDSSGRIFEETVVVELLPGEGYQLSETKEATLRIQDDDVPGVRIVQVGDNTVVQEGEVSSFKVSLLSEPQKDVTIRLTPGAEIDFVNPVNPTKVKVNKEVYSFGVPTDVDNISFKLNSLVTSEKDKTIAFDVRFTQKPDEDVIVEFYDANDKGNNVESKLNFTSVEPNEIIGEQEGNWNESQQVIIGNLDSNSNGKLALIAKVKDTSGNQIGDDINLAINRTVTQVEKQTTEITITPDKWFELQTVAITGTDEGIAEPGLYHESAITYQVVSKDADYNNIFVPQQRIDVVDRVLNAETTAQSVREGLTSLQKSLDNLSVPIVGSLKGKTPDLIGKVSDKLVTAISGQQNLSGNRLKSIIEGALSTIGLDFIKVKVDMNEDDINISLNIKKKYNIFELSLDAGLGLDALGIGFKTEGKIKSDFSFDVGLGFGLHKDFGFYIDTNKTKVNATIKLNLDNFKGQGNLGPVRLDMQDDSQNPTELAITFKAGIKDLDNYHTIKFLDVNGNGILDAQTFDYGIKVDKLKENSSGQTVSGKDGKADTDKDDKFITEVRQVQEPFTQVNDKGKASPFPTVNQASNEAKQVNWNGNNSFDAPQDKKNEGIYRTQKDAQGNITNYYLDLNRNGNFDEKSKKVKENLFSVAPGTSKWFDNQGRIKPFRIEEKKVDGNLKYYFDKNGNNSFDTEEELTKKEKSNIDKNNNNKLDADVDIEGEGLFVQGKPIAFQDANGNGLFDVGESYVNSKFGPLKINGSDLKFTFLDLDGDKSQAGSISIGNKTIQNSLTEYFFKTDKGSLYLDITEDNKFTEKYYQEGGKQLSEPKLVKAEGQEYFFLDINGDKKHNSAKEPSLNEVGNPDSALDIDFSGSRNNVYEPIINRGSSYLNFFDEDEDGKQQKLIDFNRNGQKDDSNKDFITESSIQTATNPNNTTFEYLDISNDGYWTREHQVIEDGGKKYLDTNNNSKKDDSDREIVVINDPNKVKIENDKKNKRIYLDANGDSKYNDGEKLLLDNLTGRFIQDANKNGEIDDEEQLINVQRIDGKLQIVEIKSTTINYTGEDEVLKELNGKKINYLDETNDDKFTREYKVIKDDDGKFTKDAFNGFVLDINDNDRVDFAQDKPAENDPLILFTEANVREEKTGTFINSGSFKYIDYNHNGEFDADASERSPKEYKLVKDGDKLKIDKNNNGKADTDETVAKVREFLDTDDNGQFTDGADLIVDEKKVKQGQNDIKLKFNDANRNGNLDNDEAIIYNTIDFLDLNGDSQYDENDFLTKGKYFDINGNNINDPGEPQKSGDDWKINEDNVVSYQIVTNDGKTFIDQKAKKSADKGTYQQEDDIDLFKSFSITTAQAKILGLEKAGSYTAAQLLGLTVDNGKVLETEITFVDLEGDKKLNVISDPIVKIENGIRYVDFDRNGTLTKNENDKPIEAFSKPNNEFDTDDLEGTGKIIKLLDDGDRLTLKELKNWKNDKELKFSDLFKYNFAGIANLGLKTQASVKGDPAFPKIGLDIGVGLPLFNFGDQSKAGSNGLSVEFNNITLDFGTFLTKFATPIINTVEKIISPVKPVLKVLNSDTKIFSAIGLENEFNKDGKPGVSILDLGMAIAEAIPEDTTNEKLKRIKESIPKAVKFIQTVTNIIELSDNLKKLVDSGENIVLELGSYDLDDFKGASNDPSDAAAKIDPSKQGNKTNSPKGTPTEQAENSNTASKEQKGALNKLKNLDGLEIPILDNPITLIRILLGEPNVDLIKYDIPDLEYFFGKEQEFLLYTPPTIKGLLELGFEAKTDLSVGYDTGGLEAWKKDDFELSKIYKVLDGFYLDDWDSDGNEKDELSAKATIAAGLSASIVVVKAILKGGVEGYLGFDVVDEGELQGKNDGKVRGSEIISRIDTPLQLFDLKGSLDAFLKGEIRVGLDVGLFEIMKTVWSKELARITVAKFNVGASGITFSSSLSNSYINAATIFFDANFNGVWDAEIELNGEIVAEPITFTNEYGEYNLEIGLDWDSNADGVIDIKDGQLIGIGGFDTSSGTEAGKFLGLPGSAILTPLTSLQVTLVREGLLPDEAGNLIKEQLGLDADFDLSTFDSLEAVGQNNTTGLNVYLLHIQVQSLFNQARAFLDGNQGEQANPNNFQLVQEEFAKFLENRSTDTRITDSFNLSDNGDIEEFLFSLAKTYTTTATLEQIKIASSFIATSNQLLNTVRDIGASKSIEAALPALASVKRITQTDVAQIIKKLTSNQQTITELQAEFKETLYQNYILVDGDINSFGNRSVAIKPQSVTTAEESQDTIEFTIELSHPAPNQGLKVLYSVSGTATIGEDYTTSEQKLGEAYIAPGETTTTVSFSISDDVEDESLESIVLNLKSTGEGFILNPSASVALLQIIDNDQDVNTSDNNGLTLEGTFGDDELTGDLGNDTLEGLYANDTLNGQAGNDFLQGGHGEDSLIGGDGDDTLNGNFGNDIIQGNAGKDIIKGGSGNDEIAAGNDTDNINAGVGNDTVSGDAGNDQIKGAAGDDILNGGADNDWLLGNDGNDLLIGGLGKDFLNGGSGADVFYFDSANQGFDKILDFNPEQGDKIQVSASGFGITDLSGFRFISGILDYNGQNLALIQNQGNTYSYFPDLTQIIEIVDQPTPVSLSDNITDDLTVPPQLERTFNIENPELTTLDDIIARGKLLVAESEFSSNFDLEFARAISAVLFGDADKFEIVEAGEDIGTTRFINNVLVPDLDLSPVYFYDYEAIVVRQNSGINNALDLNGRTIGIVEAQASQALFDTLYLGEGIDYSEKFYNSIDEMVAAYDKGEIDAYSTDSAVIYENLANLSDPDNHQILDVEIAKVPVSLTLPENDSQLRDVIRWLTYVPTQAEEFGITSENIDQFLAINTDDNPNNDSSLEIRRFLGLEGNLGATLGLPNDFAINIIRQVGNYAEIYNRHFPGLERGRNLLARDGGLLYSPPFSGTANQNLEFVDNDNRDVLQEVLERGSLKVGINGKAPGFSQTQENAEITGFDVDLGRAIAAALFGDPNKVEFIQQDNLERFTNVANGIVDISANQITHNLVRDASFGIDYSPIYLYTGQGVMIRKNSGISNLAMLNGRKIGVVANTTSKQNLEDELFELGGTVLINIYDTEAQMLAAYDKAEVDAISHDLPLLSAAIPNLSNPEEHFVLDEVLSKEPLGIAVDENQSRWMEVISAVYTALVQAEEYGITSENIDQIIQEINNKELTSTFAIDYFLGLDETIADSLESTYGLTKEFAVNAIKAVGNYGEIYNRHFNDDILRRDANALSSEYGLQYALPLGLGNDFDEINHSEEESEKLNVKITLTNQNSKTANQIGIVLVDDKSGSINGILPGEDGYTEAAIAKGEIIFSTITNYPNGFNSGDLQSIIELNSNHSFRFFYIENSSIESVTKDNNAIEKLIFSSQISQSISDLSADGINITWNHSNANNQSLDLEIKIEQTAESMILGTALQNQPEGEVIHLLDVDINQTVNAEFSVFREASYDNYVGFYKVVDENGGIDTNGDGIADINPGDDNYIQTAIDNRIQGIDLTVENQGSATYNSELSGGSIYAPFIIVNGNPDDVEGSAEDPEVYFTYLGANSDGQDHIRMLGDNTFGFEDLPNGGDLDYNDIIIRTKLI
ncbi:MAG: DUF4347 domain-containing protein [Rivularia sp. (in: Bacteria)]|nr:DUF4347 domain-containing protein [Rivularia sp. MS3]